MVNNPAYKKKTVLESVSLKAHTNENDNQDDQLIEEEITTDKTDFGNANKNNNTLNPNQSADLKIHQ